MAAVGGLGRWCGVAPRSNLSMMSIRPPQHGQRFVVCGSAALGLIALMASTGIIGGMSSSRARERVYSRQSQSGALQATALDQL